MNLGILDMDAESRKDHYHVRIFLYIFQRLGICTLRQDNHRQPRIKWGIFGQHSKSLLSLQSITKYIYVILLIIDVLPSLV